MRTYFPRCRVRLGALLDVAGDDALHRFELTPRQVSVHRTHFREADTFRLTVGYRELPLDPRSLRQLYVEIYLGEVRGSDAVLPMDRDHLAFVGYVDEPRLRRSETGDMLELEGRDHTALLLDHTWDGTRQLDITGGLSAVVRRVLERVTGASTMPTRFTAGAADLDLSRHLGRTKYSPVGNDDSAWDVLTDLCGRVGLLPAVRFDTLSIRAPSDVAELAAELTYGRDIERLELRRKLNGGRLRQVRVRSWDPEERTSREATFPKGQVVTRAKIRAGGGGVDTETAPIITYQVSGPYSVGDLEAMAERIWNEAAREEVEGTLQTFELRDVHEAPLVRLGNGDLITVRVDEDLDDPTVRGGVVGAEVEALRAARRRAGALVVDFYVKSTTHRWSIDDGYALDVKFINLVGSTS